MEINGVYNLMSKQNLFFECDCWQSNGQSFEARVLCNEQYTNPQNLLNYIEQYNCRKKLDEDGLFLAVVYYKGQLYFFADSTTSQWVLYYTKIGDKVYYSTSLKKLLKSSGIKRYMDLIAAKGFLKNGIVLGNQTLVEGVKKLDAGEIIILKNGKIKSKHIRYSITSSKKCSDLIGTLRQSVNRYANNIENVYMPLSGGYDSNLILDTLEKSNHTIDAFTVGGEIGKNEIQSVKNNIKTYKNITHHTCLANQTLFTKLAEIVWRLDGYVYERGVFLQYLLADLVSKNNGKTFICGECSDEHQHLLYKKEAKRVLHKKTFSPLETVNWMLQPYSQGNFIVMKKSSLMLNSFGIKSCYPFATKKFTDVAATFGKENLDGKQLYIKLLKKELPKDLYDGLIHAGGATSIEAIICQKDIDELHKIVAENDLINKIKNDTPDCYTPLWADFYELFLSEKGKTSIRLMKGYVKYTVKSILTKLNLYHNRIDRLDDSLETDIKAYYLMLFSDLFLSDKVNYDFDSSNINKSI